MNYEAEYLMEMKRLKYALLGPALMLIAGIVACTTGITGMVLIPAPANPAAWMVVGVFFSAVLAVVGLIGIAIGTVQLAKPVGEWWEARVEYKLEVYRRLLSDTDSHHQGR